jgi:prephenate dehydratase/prephenate dehydrogenase
MDCGLKMKVQKVERVLRMASPIFRKDPMVSVASSLIVVGAAGGIGRWLCEHVLNRQSWSKVCLVDTGDTSRTLLDVAAGFSDPVTCVEVEGSRLQAVSSDAAIVFPAHAIVFLAVPLEAVPAVGRWLTPHLSSTSVICGVSATQLAMREAIRQHFGAPHILGLHPLTEASARSSDGHTFIIIDEDEHSSVPILWLRDLIDNCGGLTKTMSPAAHDAAMSYVQTMAHQALLHFANALTNGSAELQELWELRTPLFESLLGLSVRVLAEGQQTAMAEIQVSTDGPRIADEFRLAERRLEVAISIGSLGIEEFIKETRNKFGGSLFDVIRTTAASALSANLSKRAQLEHHRRLSDLVGLRRLDRPDALRVGRIMDISPVKVTLLELMFGNRHSAAIVDGPGRENARRLGVSGTPRQVSFALGHVEVVAGQDLEEALDEWLAFIQRDVRFLVPESVAGEGVRASAASARGIRGAEIVSEVVRTGQRSVVARVLVRSDSDVEDAIEGIRAHVQEAYAWPQGVSLSSPSAAEIHYLGPAGTFSEIAAKRAVLAVGARDSIIVVEDSFDSVLRNLGKGSLGMIPISSSASGLVDRAVSALLRHTGALVVGGVVDVPIRFDAYISTANQLSGLRGKAVYSHPQALDQCSNFINRWGLIPVKCSSTTESLQLVARRGGGAVAIAPADVAHDLRLKVAEREIDDLFGSITRFLILGDVQGGSDPTLRTIFISDSVNMVAQLLKSGEPAFDELLTAGNGHCLWVTSRILSPSDSRRVRFLGRAPWSPRTPVVRVEVEPRHDERCP